VLVLCDVSNERALSGLPSAEERNRPTLAECFHELRANVACDQTLLSH
jgi:hypothetical protein